MSIHKILLFILAAGSAGICSAQQPPLVATTYPSTEQSSRPNWPLTKGVAYTTLSLVDALFAVAAALALHEQYQALSLSEKIGTGGAMAGFAGASSWFAYKAYRSFTSQALHSTEAEDKNNARSRAVRLLRAVSLVGMELISLTAIASLIPVLLGRQHIGEQITDGLIMALLGAQTISLGSDVYHERNQLREDLISLFTRAKKM